MRLRCALPSQRRVLARALRLLCRFRGTKTGQCGVSLTDAPATREQRSHRCQLELSFLQLSTPLRCRMEPFPSHTFTVRGFAVKSIGDWPAEYRRGETTPRSEE